jgi:hypothetical protein
MGGFTQIKLKDCSEENIKIQNELLNEYDVPREYRFQDLKKDQEEEYKYFKKGEGSFPEHLFPKDKIKTLADFRKYWTPSAVGECFVPPSGTLQFDCYFGRTPEDVMYNIGRYVAENVDAIKETCGSFTTFMERGMTEEQRKIVEASDILWD